MPERTFGRTVKYRRSKLGLSQAKLGELVGRSASSVRSWERDSSVPKESSVIVALSAILGVDETMLFEKAGMTPPAVESSPTIEQELATLSPEPETVKAREDPLTEVLVDDPTDDSVELVVDVTTPDPEPTPAPAPNRPVVTESVPAYAAPKPRHAVTAATPPAHEPSYMEDRSQRQLYRVRTLATIVGLVGLGIVLLWSFTEGLTAIGEWWDDFFGNLRL